MNQAPPPHQPLRDLLTVYEAAIAPLNTLSTLPPADQAKAIWAVLLARDDIQARLSQGQISATEVLQLEALDTQLKTHQAAIQAVAPLSDWRQLYQPNDDAWWWQVPPAPEVEQAQQFDWLWNGLSIVFLAVSASLILNTASRFWGGSLASAGTLTLAVQSALTLIVGKGALTQSGREGWEKFLKDRGIAKHHWQEWSCTAAGGVLVVVGGLHSSLPTIAIVYNTQGERHYLANRLASALSNYQVALHLRPDYPEAHYNLGLVYEDLQKADEATPPTGLWWNGMWRRWTN